MDENESSPPDIADQNAQANLVDIIPEQEDDGALHLQPENTESDSSVGGDSTESHHDELVESQHLNSNAEGMDTNADDNIGNDHRETEDENNENIEKDPPKVESVVEIVGTSNGNCAEEPPECDLEPVEPECDQSSLPDPEPSFGQSIDEHVQSEDKEKNAVNPTEVNENVNNVSNDSNVSNEIQCSDQESVKDNEESRNGDLTGRQSQTKEHSANDRIEETNEAVDIDADNKPMDYDALSEAQNGAITDSSDKPNALNISPQEEGHESEIHNTSQEVITESNQKHSSSTTLSQDIPIQNGIQEHLETAVSDNIPNSKQAMLQSNEALHDIVQSDNFEMDHPEVPCDIKEASVQNEDAKQAIVQGENNKHAVVQNDSIQQAIVQSDNTHQALVQNDNIQQALVQNDNIQQAIVQSDNTHQALVQNDNIQQAIVQSDDDLLSELESELETKTTEMILEKPLKVSNGPPPRPPPMKRLPEQTINGICDLSLLKDVPEFKKLQNDFDQLMSKHDQQQIEINRMKGLTIELDETKKQRDTLQAELNAIKTSSTEDIYMAQIKEMENTLAEQSKEIQAGKDKLLAHDAAAKRAITKLQQELKHRLDQVSKMYEDCLREKDSMVVKFAQGESKILELQKTIDKMDKQIRDSVKEKDMMASKMKNMRVEFKAMVTQLEKKTTDHATLTKEFTAYKDNISSQDVKVKWATNKLKAEQDAHKETKEKLTQMTNRFKEAKEETNIIRRDCQAMIKTYQTSEDIKSVSLDKELQKKEDELKMQIQEKTDQDEVHNMVISELESLKKKHKELLEELRIYKDKAQCLDAEHIRSEETLNKFKEIIQRQKQTNQELKDKVEYLDNVEKDLNHERVKCETLREQVQSVEEQHKDTIAEIELCRTREGEMLELTQKLTAKNATLQSENTGLATKLSTLTTDHQRLNELSQQLERRNNILSEQLSEEQKLRSQEADISKKQLEAKSKTIAELTTRVEEEKDENKTLKRKHANNIKDLTRQLQQARRKMENMESHIVGENNPMSGSSRTSSNGSLETAVNQNSGNNSGPTSRASSQEPAINEDLDPPVQVVEVDRQMLIEKIVRLQKAHARKNEKMEFMSDHIKQLLDEVQKKSKIIGNYIMREESGALASESMDENKAQLVKKGGIMASVYSSHQSDGHLNLELSLEINKKLQAVLEDTLLKNITLKNNLETLGEEIARLSQENRQMQLNNK